MIKIENFNPDKKSYENIDIDYIGYIRKDSKYVNIYSLNPLYMIIGEVNESIEEKNGSKCLTFADTNKNKKVLKNTQNFGVRLRLLLKK